MGRQEGHNEYSTKDKRDEHGTKEKRREPAKDKDAVAAQQDSEGERYECVVCGRSYKHYFHLKAHKRECSVEPLFRCEECHKRFYHSRNLGRHMQNVHKKTPKRRTTTTVTADAQITSAQGP